jgi:hypothetical protein
MVPRLQAATRRCGGCGKHSRYGFFQGSFFMFQRRAERRGQAVAGCAQEAPALCARAVLLHFTCWARRTKLCRLDIQHALCYLEMILIFAPASPTAGALQYMARSIKWLQSHQCRDEWCLPRCNAVYVYMLSQSLTSTCLDLLQQCSMQAVAAMAAACALRSFLRTNAQACCKIVAWAGACALAARLAKGPIDRRFSGTFLGFLEAVMLAGGLIGEVDGRHEAVRLAGCWR